MAGNANSGRRKGERLQAAAIHILRGNPSKRPIAEEPRPRPGIPSCPEWMPAIGREAWIRLADQLGYIPGFLAEPDWASLERFCYVYATWREAIANLAITGSIYSVRVPYAEGGEENSLMWKPRPEVKIARDAGAEIDRLTSKLGLSPADRARIAVHPASKPKDGLLDDAV